MKTKGLGFDSVLDCLPSLHEALGLIPGQQQQQQQQQKRERKSQEREYKNIK
jgi:hypothetical protein